MTGRFADGVLPVVAGVGDASLCHPPGLDDAPRLGEEELAKAGIAAFWCACRSAWRNIKDILADLQLGFDAARGHGLENRPVGGLGDKYTHS